MKFSKSVSALLAVVTLTSSLVSSKSFAADPVASKPPADSWDDETPVAPAPTKSAIKMPELSPETRAAMAKKMDEANAQLNQAVTTLEAKYAAAKSEDEKKQYSREAVLVLEKYSRLALNIDLSTAQQTAQTVPEALIQFQDGHNRGANGVLIASGAGSVVVAGLISLITAKDIVLSLARSPSILFGSAARRQLQTQSGAALKTWKAPFRFLGRLTGLTLRLGVDAVVLVASGTYVYGVAMSPADFDETVKSNDLQIKRIDDEITAIHLLRK